MRADRRHLARAFPVLMTLFVMTGTAAARNATEVVDAARSASGGAAWSDVTTLESQGDETFVGLKGSWRLIQDVAHGRSAQVDDFGVFSTADVYDGTTRWRRDRSGGVHALNGAFSIQFARTDAWLARRDYLRPGAGGAALGPLTEQMEDNHRYSVFTATPPQGAPAELWFDGATALLTRVVRQMPTDQVIVRLSDYRPVQGLMLPFHIEETEGHDTRIASVRQYAVQTVPAADAYARPTTPDDTRLSHLTLLPIENDQFVVVEARLNGRGPFAFILDTGGHNILTPAAAESLGLTAVGNGQSGGAGPGTLAEQNVRVADLQLGDAELRDQHFYVIPLSYGTVERGTRPPLAGIIGLELFERLQVRIDYRQKTLTLAPPRQPGFCTGQAVPIRFDDDIPLVDGRIDGLPGVVAIDTGNAGSSVVQGVWAAAAGLATKLKAGQETVSFGNGGVSRNWLSGGHTVNLGAAMVTNTELRYAEDTQGAFSSRTEAANFGQAVLAHYTVGFDYAEGRMCLEPEPGYVPPPMDRSGLALSKDNPHTFSVVRVRAGSPGAAAGIHEGDKILAVNGRMASELSGVDVARALRASPGQRVELKCSRGGEISTVTVVLPDPVPEPSSNETAKDPAGEGGRSNGALR